jgi:hypothetical protein
VRARAQNFRSRARAHVLKFLRARVIWNYGPQKVWWFASHFWRIIRINSPKFALFKLTLVEVFLFVFGLKMVVVVIGSSIWPWFCPIMVVFFRILTKTFWFFQDLFSFNSMKIQNFNFNTDKFGVILLTHILIDF